MTRYFLAIWIVFFPLFLWAQENEAIVSNVVGDHILPQFALLADNAAKLDIAAENTCDATSDELRNAFGNAFDAWVSVSHLRFGPTEVDDRAFALAFWPDPRSATPKTLSRLLNDRDPVAISEDKIGEISIAARGFYALEFLLYDETLMSVGDQEYRCALIRTISADIAQLSGAINADWIAEYSIQLTSPNAAGKFRSTDEAVQKLLGALNTGLQFTADARLGRPLGTFDRPRPSRAEARRSGRSNRHVELSITSLRGLSEMLAVGDTDLSARLDSSFDRALGQLNSLDDPTFAGVTDRQERFKIEAVQSTINAIRTLVQDELGPKLGVVAGFNALDGD